MGTGPYRLTRWSSGDKIVLEANDRYHEGRPNVDRYVYRMLPADIAALGGGPVALAFRSQNDGDSLPTDFRIDAVRFCYKSLETPTPSATRTPSASPSATPT